MARVLFVVAASAVIMLTGFVHGRLTQRWNPTNELMAAAAGLDRIPVTVGDWQAETLEVEPEEVRQANLTACWMRRYTNVKTGSIVTALLMCGRPGPVSAHTPQWCYGGAGYEMAADAERFSLPSTEGSPSAEFWTAKFSKNDAGFATQLRLFWSWNAAGRWQAPDSPRLAFARNPALYKLYVRRDLNTAREPLQGDPCIDLMNCLLPQLQESLSFS